MMSRGNEERKNPRATDDQTMAAENYEYFGDQAEEKKNIISAFTLLSYR